MSEPMAQASNAALLIARLLLSLIFLHEGGTLLINFRDATASVAPMGVSPAMLAGTIALQLLAGAAIALGWQARLAAIALSGFCVATAFLFHTRLSVQNELLHFEKDLAIAGGMLALAVAGSGAWSIAALRRPLRAATARPHIAPHPAP